MPPPEHLRSAKEADFEDVPIESDDDGVDPEIEEILKQNPEKRRHKALQSAPWRKPSSYSNFVRQCKQGWSWPDLMIVFEFKAAIWIEALEVLYWKVTSWILKYDKSSLIIPTFALWHLIRFEIEMKGFKL